MLPHSKAQCTTLYHIYRPSKMLNLSKNFLIAAEKGHTHTVSGKGAAAMVYVPSHEWDTCGLLWSAVTYIHIPCHPHSSILPTAHLTVGGAIMCCSKVTWVAFRSPTHSVVYNTHFFSLSWTHTHSKVHRAQRQHSTPLKDYNSVEHTPCKKMM